ncbi:terminase large subunit [Pleionea sediminis]|uniref:terminase large subunit n=1 Tax=Pleionea sediminis TaxID=2569479 RepID=UPI001185BFB1|nr:terminase TerL endonuclease subunit [Pleionea sediminis]
MSATDHLDDILAYCDRVLSGERPACQWERLAVERFYDDFERSKTGDFEFYFDVEKAVQPIKFIELLPHVKGKWANRKGLAKRIQLEGWQKFIIANLFGWLKKSTGYRRFVVAYICVSRKNGKSIIAAGVGLYMLVQDNEFGAEVYCGATTEKQAWEVFRPAKQMVERTPQLRAAYGLTAHAKRLECDKKGSRHTPDGSKFEPVIGKPGDGASPSCAILDEVHEHDDDVLFDTMLTGMGAREQPLLLMITTAGTNPSGPCFQHQKDLQRTLSANAGERNEELFGIVYGIDKNDDWTSTEVLEKANPNIGISVGKDYLIARQKDAMRSPRKQNAFKIKHLDEWVYAKNAWLNMVDWANAADTSLERDDFIGCKAIKGLDMSSKLDITADVTMFEKMIEGEQHFFFFGNYYIPEALLKDPDKQLYVEWEHQGHLITCEGDTIDYEQVQSNAINECRLFDIEELAFDPWGATQIAQNIHKANSDIELVEVPQSYAISDAMKEFERLLKEGRIHHDGNPALSWMMGNVVAKEIDDGKKIRPVKEERDNKIDGAVAAIMALSRAIVIDEQQVEHYGV